MTTLLDALIMQESSGRPGIAGQKTKYGQPFGLGQMLPGTGMEMAANLGMPWRPDLMKGTSPEAAQYQAKLAGAYLQEGQAKTGNDRDALRYYHGGPNRKLWGPKTNAYADQVLARVGKGPTIRDTLGTPADTSPQAQRMAQYADAQPTAAPSPAPLHDEPLGIMDGPDEISGLPQFAMPDVPQIKKGGILGSGLTLGEVLAHGLNGYLAGIGNPVGEANIAAFHKSRIMDQERAQDLADKETERQSELEKLLLKARIEASEPPAFVRNAAAWAALSPEQQQQVRSYYDVVSPVMADVQGDDGVYRQVIPRGGGQVVPQVGTVEDGFVFMGGVPSDQRNWRPM